MFSSTGDPDGPPGAWEIDRPDGSRMRWEGFYTGPVELSRDDLAHAARQILNLSLDEVAVAAASYLRPSTHDDGTGPCIVLHSATPVLKSLQGDLAEVAAGRIPDDVAAYVETRAVSLARPGDLVVGRTYTWQVAAQMSGVEAVVIPGIDYFYLSQAIIKLILETGGQAPQLKRLARALAQRPDTVVRLYSLDTEVQIVLLYLRREAGIPHLYTDANSPQVAGYWNTKAPIHPLVTEAVRVSPGDAVATLAEETELAPMRQRLGVSYQRLPGYAIDTATETVAELADRLLLAARLLGERYGITLGCVKPSEGGGGARITSGVKLTDQDALRGWAERLWPTRELFVVEAHVLYQRLPIGGRAVSLAPSAHVRYGKVAEGITVQLTNGPQWQGNVYLDERACADVGVAVDLHNRMRQTVEDLRRAFAAHGETLITGGIDFAVGQVGGDFADQPFVALQDPNLSSHGAEYLRRFLDQMCVTAGPSYAATKVFRPTFTGSLPALRGLDYGGFSPENRYQVISAIPGRWGMLAVAAASPHRAVEEVLAWEKDLIGKGMTFDVPQRSTH